MPATKSVPTPAPADMKKMLPQIVARSVISLVFIGLAVFLLAGTIGYWQGWLYLGLNALVMCVGVVVLADRPEMLRERLKPGPGMKAWDYAYFSISTTMYLAMLVLAPLDRGRFFWSPELPLWAYIASSTLFLAAHAVFIWAKHENKFLSSVVRIQKERGHSVCVTGPYRFVRHPSYVAGIIFSLASPFMMGSLMAAVPQAIAVIALVARTALEDATLKRELEGYKEYARTVRYRLIPFVW